MSAEKIEELKKQRSQFIHKLYEFVDGSESRIVRLETIGNELGFNRDKSFQIGEYLKGENLLKFVTMGGGVQLTHFGVQEVEEAISNPDQPTEHFLPVNVINIGTMNNSQIQQGTINSIQTQIIEQAKIPEIQEILQKISNSLEQLELQGSDKEDLKIDIETVNAQLKSSKPKRSIILECFGSMTNILANAASSALATELSEALSNISL